MKKMFTLGLAALSLVGLNAFANEEEKETKESTTSEVEKTIEETTKVFVEINVSSSEDKEEKDLNLSVNDEDKETSTLIG